MSKPSYVYVASSWRNPVHAAVCATLRAAGIDHYDFKNPPSSTGFSWFDVQPEIEICGVRGMTPDGPIVCRRAPHEDDRHSVVPEAALLVEKRAAKAKGTDWEPVHEYLRMVHHPRADEGFAADFGAMQKADTFVLVLPCGKSAHLELGWAVGAGKRTAILLEDPVEPELMYRMVDYLAPTLVDLLGWLGVDDAAEADR